ncbi:MAG: LPXTG cell wall anchor domain-containing protein [Acidimicrobiales bacterium]
MHSRNRSRARRIGAALFAGSLGFGSLAILNVSPAGADAVGEGSAYAFGGEVTLGGSDVIRDPEATVTAPTGDDANTVIDIPADPVVVSGTFTAEANVHEASDIETALTVNEQAVAGPYNARGVGEIEDAQVLLDVAGEGVPLLSAALIRAEAAAVCTAGTVTYTANSEIVDLQIGGNAVPLNDPVETIIDGITTVLQESGLDAAVSVERNVVTELEGGGIAVDALVVTIAGGDIATIRLAHGEVGPTSCALPECSDNVDNDGDGTIDIDDPACHTDKDATNPASYDPLDDSETKECSDTIDNADPEDTLADADDPGCHTDGDANNPASYDPFDHDETDDAVRDFGVLPRTGGTPTGAIAGAGLLAAALGALALRRRVTA